MPGFYIVGVCTRVVLNSWSVYCSFAVCLWMRMKDLRPIHNTTLNNVLHCVVFSLTLVETQHDARIDSDSILAFPCVAFLHLVVKKLLTFLVINLCILRHFVNRPLESVGST